MNKFIQRIIFFWHAWFAYRDFVSLIKRKVKFIEQMHGKKAAKYYRDGNVPSFKKFCNTLNRPTIKPKPKKKTSRRKKRG